MFDRFLSSIFIPPLFKSFLVPILPVGFILLSTIFIPTGYKSFFFSILPWDFFQLFTSPIKPSFQSLNFSKLVIGFTSQFSISPVFLFDFWFITINRTTKKKININENKNVSLVFKGTRLIQG